MTAGDEKSKLMAEVRPLLEPRLEHAPSGCPDIVALWSQKLEGDLSQRDCSSMEKHLLTCPACGAACDALKQALVACQGVRGEWVPPQIQASVKAAVRAWASHGAH